MPLPTKGDVHVNRPLTNISLAFVQSEANYIGHKAFPNIPVAKQSDRYWVYDKGDWLRDEMEVRAAATASAGNGYRLDSTNTYFCDNFAFHKDIADQVRNNEDSPLNSDKDAAIFVTQKAMIKRERQFAADALAASVWDNELQGVNSDVTTGSEFLFWNDANSTPIEDLRTGKRTVLQNTGFEPNILVMNQVVFDALVDHPDLVDRIKYGQSSGNTAIVNEQTLAALFGLEQVLVSKAVYDSAAENATDSPGFIAGDHALLLYRPRNPGLMTPSAGYNFSWTGQSGNTPMGHRIKKFRMEELASDRVEVEMAFDFTITGSELGYFFNTAADFSATISV